MKNVLTHIGFWSFMLLFIFDYHWFEVSWLTAFWHSLVEIISYAVLFYGTLWFFNQFNQQLWLFCFGVASLILVYIFIIRASGLENYLYEAEGKRNLFSMLMNAVLFCGMAILFATSKQSTVLREKNLTLQANNKALQLDSLKAKINPHFIFNTLNNLNALIIKEDKRLPDFLNEFSTLLRYSIDEGNNEVIPLVKEIACIQSYFYLLEMQVPLATDIDLYVEGDATNKVIAPFIITTLVENAIKHSDIQINEHGHLNCHISCDENGIQIELSNSMKAKPNAITGKGLQIIQQQLQLNYGDDFELIHQTKKNTYVVNLDISSTKIYKL